MSPRRAVRPAPPRQQYTGYVIVRLHEAVAHPLAGPGGPGIATVASNVAGFDDLLHSFPRVLITPLVTGISPLEILELERRAAESEFPPLRSLTSYLLLDARAVSDPRVLLHALRRHWAVDFAYLEVHLGLPQVTPDPLSANQKHLDPAPVGIDAEYAWTIGVDGAQVGFVDVERAWNTTHEDLVGWPPTLIYNNLYNIPDEIWHGTAVLGVVAAKDNGLGLLGIAPGVKGVRMTSMYDANTGRLDDLAKAVTNAIPLMHAGDVLLVEAQIGDSHPVEIHPDKFDAIRLAVGNAITVVECAGNGEVQLDDWICGSTSGYCLNRGKSADFTDSGAIMVGSCNSVVVSGGHVRHWSSNYGSRIDCYAWGEKVWTTGSKNAPLANNQYSGLFNGTSSAGAIIAGAALLVQSRFRALSGGPLSPSQVRALLSDPATGTPQVEEPGDPPGAPSKKINVMPDLKLVLAQVGTTPDVYLRDSLGDDGSLPSSGAAGLSPDIIVVPASAGSPVWAGNENSSSLSQPVMAGQGHHVYFRVKNRGTGPANAVTGKAYWCPSATLLTPANWHPIGVSAAVAVPVAGGLTVAGPIVWPAASIPPAGHYCFIGILNDAADPAPPIPGPMDWPGFLAFIGGSNNVAWRNFDVLQPTQAGEWITEPFSIWGAPDKARTFSFEFLQELPVGVRTLLEIPATLLKLLPQTLLSTPRRSPPGDMYEVPLPQIPRFVIDGVKLARNHSYPCRLLLRGQPQTLPPGTTLAVRQLYAHQVVGGINWKPPPA